VKVLIVDDHAMMREGLQALLATRAEVIFMAVDGRDAVALARRHRPDVVVMDVTMPGLNGIDATRQIVRESSDTKVIGLSVHADHRYVAAMFQAGASGYVLKDSTSGELLEALDAVCHGRTYFAAPLAGAAVDALTKSEPVPPSTRLTKREREVLQLVAEGCTSKEIGSRLHVAPTTAESHRRQIMSKLELHSVAELTKFAIREGLTPLEK
jgi:DNA-binding NarL/FixJ family response regulator